MKTFEIYVTEDQFPTNDDKEAWNKFWKSNNQPWRTEPIISDERQQYLAERLEIEPDIKQGIYPFKDIKLNRANVEWLLSTHESNGMRGPVDWNDESQREREGLDLRGADLSNEDLSSLPLAKVRCSLNSDETLELVKKNLSLENYPIKTHLQGANLGNAQLQHADLNESNLQGANLFNAQLQGAILCEAQLQGTKIKDVELADVFHNGPQLADVQWGDTNLAVVDWSKVKRLGDECEANQEVDREDGQHKGSFWRFHDYQTATRAYRQLSVAMRNQGLNEEAARFAFRAQLMQRKVFWHKRKFLSFFGSLFLDLLSGYGYRFWRSFLAYAFVIAVFAAIYSHISPHLVWYESIVISMTAFHGRGFFSTQFSPGDPQAIVAAIEAFVGLFIEITLIATLTQRLFGK